MITFIKFQARVMLALVELSGYPFIYSSFIPLIHLSIRVPTHSSIIHYTCICSRNQVLVIRAADSLTELKGWGEEIYA